MGKFKHLTEGKEKSMMIGEVEFKISPLKGKYLGLFMAESAKEDSNKNILLMILATLKETDSSLTMEDVEELPIEITTKLLEMVYEVNGFASKQ